MTLGNVATLDPNIATLKLPPSETSRRWISTSQHWEYNSRERRNVGPNVATLPCFYEHKHSFFSYPKPLKNPNRAPIFADTQKMYPSLSQLILETPKALRTFLDLRITSAHLSLEFLVTVWVSGKSRLRFNLY